MLLSRGHCLFLTGRSKVQFEVDHCHKTMQTSCRISFVIVFDDKLLNLVGHKTMIKEIFGKTHNVVMNFHNGFYRLGQLEIGRPSSFMNVQSYNQEDTTYFRLVEASTSW